MVTVLRCKQEAVPRHVVVIRGIRSAGPVADIMPGDCRWDDDNAQSVSPDPERPFCLFVVEEVPLVEETDRPEPIGHQCQYATARASSLVRLLRHACKMPSLP